MKKSLFMLLLALCMVVCFAAVTVSAEETTEHTHCVCQGTNPSDHTCNNAQGWQPLSAATLGDYFTVTSSNRYEQNSKELYLYLTEDVELAYSISIKDGKTIHLCLNGNELSIQAALNQPVMRVWGDLDVTDCSENETGAIVGNRTGEAACLYIQNKDAADCTPTVNLYAGTLTAVDGNATAMAGVVQLGNAVNAAANNYATFNMYGGTISGGTASQGGNIFLHNAASRFYMYGGTISGGTAATNGGSVYIQGGTFELFDGTITGGSAQNGGNVALNNTSAVFTMTGGTISGGTATTNGGNVFVNSGKFNMNSVDAVISGGKADAGSGGNVRISGGTFTLIEGTLCPITKADGTIVGATAKNGGNVCIGGSGTFKMQGGTVTGGTATSHGGNILTYNKLYISGGTVTGGTTTTSNGGNISVYGAGNTPQAEISGDAEISGGKAPNGMGGNLFLNFAKSSAKEQYFKLQGNATVKEGTAKNGGNIAIYAAARIDNVVIEGGTVTEGRATENGGNIYLQSEYDSNVGYNGRLTITNGTISDGAAVNGGNIYGAYTSKTIGMASEIEMSGGTISGGTATTGGSIYLCGKMTMSGGTIGAVDDKTTGGSATNGGNVALGNANASFTMNAGSTISGGTATTNGGNVHVASGTFTMEDGTISDGSASGNGGNIRLYDADVKKAVTFTLNGGTISGGTAPIGGSVAIGNSDKAVFNMAGGTVTGGNATSNHGGNFAVFGTLNITGGTISNGTAKTYGGNISGQHKNSPKIYVSGDAVITGGTAGTNGGNIYFSDETGKEGQCVFDISGGNISDGSAKLGGNIYIINGKATMSAGTISGGSADNGGSIYVTTGAAFTMTGGTISGGTATGNGGGIYGATETTQLFLLGGSITGNTAALGKDMYTTSNASVTLGGSVRIGDYFSNHNTLILDNLNQHASIGIHRDEQGSLDVFATGATTDVSSCFTILSHERVVEWNEAEGKLYLSKSAMAAVFNGNKQIKEFKTFNEAANAAMDVEGYYVKLLDNTVSDFNVTGVLYLDLNGYDLSGIIVSDTLYGMDSTTDTYDDANAGVLTYTLSGEGQVPVHHKTEADVTGAVRRYLTYTEEDGSVSFHRIYLGITRISLRPGVVGVGYKAQFGADEKAQSMLDMSEAFGYSLWLEQKDGTQIGRTATAYKGADAFSSGDFVTLRLQNFPVAEHGETLVCANVYLKLNDEAGTLISSTEYQCTLRQMLELADGYFNDYTEVQQKALVKMYADNADAMLSWDLPNIHHAGGSGWTSVTQEEFIALFANNKQNINYDSNGNPQSRTVLPAGRYVLTEKVDIGTKTIAINEGETVSICLNGYELTGAGTMFRNFGTLNICDCHKSADEGNVISTVNSTGYNGAVMYNYYESVTNLYGGNLKATGKVGSGGVLALSHDGRLENASTSKPNAAEFNMYGGTISGGQTANNGGNIVLWSGATFNLHDGTVSGGTADANGGNIHSSSGCTVNIYGGTIEGGTSATYGGNIYNSGKLNMYGGTVTGGTGTGLGDGIFVDTKASTYISGNVIIDGNGDSNLYKKDYWNVTIEDLGANAKIGITVGDTYGVIGVIYNDAAAKEDRFASDDEAYKVYAMNGKVLLMKAGFAAEDIESSISTFSVGYDITDINPTQEMIDDGLAMSNSRSVKDISDRGLNVTTVAITDANNKTILMVTLDLQGHLTNHQQFRDRIAAATGVDAENIYLSATHAHNTPDITSSKAANVRYVYMLTDRMIESALNAMADRTPATMQTGSFDPSVTENGKTKYFNYDRHYYYERQEYWGATVETGYYGDHFGSAPEGVSSWLGGKLSKDYVRENGGDHTMHLLAFQRDSKQPILLANWRAHPTRAYETNDIDSDVIGATRDYINGQGTYLFAYFQGAAGNMNTTSKLGDTLYSSSIGEYGNALGSQIVSAASSLTGVSTGLIQTQKITYAAPVDHSESTEERLAQANAVVAAYNKNDGSVDALIEEYGFSSIFHAQRVLIKASMGEYSNIELNVFSIGNSVAFYTAPAELWDSFSEEIENTDAFATTFCIGYCNGYVAYIPYNVTYDSYEGDFCLFKEDVAAPEMMEYYLEELQKQFENAK